MSMLEYSPPSRSLFSPLRAPSEADVPMHAAETSAAPEQSASVEPVTLLPVVTMPRTYLCPGEKHAVPRSIHLARLAAFYPNCRHCEHRTDVGQMPRSTRTRLEKTARRIEPQSLFRLDGVRGEYVNQMTRRTAEQVAAAVADRLWSQRIRRGRAANGDDASPALPHRPLAWPTVVLGLDSRHASPDLCVGVSRSLRSMGCEVVDVGRVSGPCLAFAVDHLQADAGIHVTGSGGPDLWTGLDLYGAEGIPWSLNATLAEIETRFRSELSRPTRQGGSQRFFEASVPYRASLLKHVQGLKPLHIVCHCAEPAVLETLEFLFSEIPCSLTAHLHQTPPGKDLKPGPAAGTKPPGSSTDSGNVNISIGDDGKSLTLEFASRRRLSDAEILRQFVIVSLAAAGREPGRIAIAEDADKDCHQIAEEAGLGAVTVGPGAESMARSMQEQAIPLGVQPDGRFWFRDPQPRCDAVITLGRILATLSGTKQ